VDRRRSKASENTKMTTKSLVSESEDIAEMAMFLFNADFTLAPHQRRWRIYAEENM
jgi:hypothetical protein